MRCPCGLVRSLSHTVAGRRAEKCTATNKMDAYNLAVCMAPIFLRSDDLARDVSLCHVAGSNPFASKTSSPSKFRHKHKPSRSGSSWSNLLDSDRPTFGSMLRVMVARSVNSVWPLESADSYLDRQISRDLSMTEGSLSNSQLATSISPSQAGSSLSFGAASGKASLR